jgi:serine/threonine protein kinase
VEGIADYRFVRALNDGGHGRYYLAVPPPRVHVEDDYVAVKVMPGANDASGVRRATRELRAFAAVSSSHLVRLLDAGREGDNFFYAMEYGVGGSLAQPARPLARDEIRSAVAGAARGAHALHVAGLVHRAITPDAVVLTAEGSGRLADLGLAQAFAPGQTMTGLGAMTAVEYVEPGLLSGSPPSPDSDLWSLAVTLHRALTGEGIYGDLPESDPLLCIRTVLSKAPVLNAGITDDERDLIERCLAQAAVGGPLDAAGFAAELDSMTGAA